MDLAVGASGDVGDSVLGHIYLLSFLVDQVVNIGFAVDRSIKMEIGVRTRERTAFQEAKHFRWRLTTPRTSDEFPGRVYFSAAVLVGSIVVVIGRHNQDWPNTRVIFYDIKKHSWSIVHSNGANTQLRESHPPVLGLVGEQVFFLDVAVPVVRCFDLVLRHWIPLNVNGITAGDSSCARCFMENINSFIYWDLSKGAAVSVLDLDSLKWGEQVTKGKVPAHVDGYPSSCCHGNTVYFAWANNDQMTVLYLLSRRESRFYWSKPRVNGVQPKFAPGCTLTYSYGRLFKVGDFQSRPEDSVQIYSIDRSEWHKVEGRRISSEYTMQGENPLMGAHSTVALRDKLVVFGGIFVQAEICRFFEAMS